VCGARRRTIGPVATHRLTLPRDEIQVGVPRTFDDDKLAGIFKDIFEFMTPLPADIGHRQGFWSKTHGCIVQESCRTLQPLSGYGNDSCRIHTPFIPPKLWAEGCLLNPSRLHRCNPL
jgi:hypothetical protein